MILNTLASIGVPGMGSDVSGFQSALASGVFKAYALAFISGVGLTLTPCVYPMIAITVSVFGGSQTTRSRARGAALSATFVLGMALLFTVLGVSFALSGKVFGSFLANRWVIFAVCSVFLALSASMFGAFEMTLPSGLNNRLATVGGIGFGGAFTLGLVTALVAAPCTGPFMTGLLLWLSTTKDALLGGSVMFAFALGLGLPFFLVGTFAIGLPKSGPWMLGAKWIFGVALAVFALQFLSTAFPMHVNTWLIEHHHRTVFATVAVVLGVVLASVHVASERRGSTKRNWSTPFKIASIPFAVFGAFVIVASSQLPKGELKWIDSEAEGRRLAVEQHLPVIIDVGADWCAACKELNIHTFADPDIRVEAGRFIAIRIDATDEDNADVDLLKQKYKVVGLPTVVLLDHSGNEQARFNEFVPAAQFLEALQQVN